MTRLTNAIFFVFLLLFPFGPAFAQDVKEKEGQFQALISRVKKSDPSVDFGLLRRLATEMPSYSPLGGGEHRAEMYSGINSGDHKKALELARKDLQDNYLDVDAHMGAMVAARELGDLDVSAHHKFVLMGIIASILATGDGKSQETAFHVISVPEEYVLINYLGYSRKGQSLVYKDGHSFDVLDVVDRETKEEHAFFFNIDLIAAYEHNIFSK